MTGRDNYRRIGEMIGVDLVTYPDLLLTSPSTSAGATVAYLDARGAFGRAEAGDWDGVRRTVQPGNDPAGLARFRQYVQALSAATAEQASAIAAQAPVAVPPTLGAINPKLLGILVGLLLGLLGLRGWRRP